MATSFVFCLVACQKLFTTWLARDGDSRRSWRDTVLAGLALGFVLWAQPFFSLSVPNGLRLTAGGIAASLAVSVVAAIWTFAAFERCQGALCVIASAAVLGLGMTASHGVLILALRGRLETGFDDMPFSAGLGLASALAAAGFAALKWWRTPAGVTLAAGCVGAAAVVSQLTTRLSINLHLIMPADGHWMAAWRLAPMAGAAAVLLVLWLRPLRRATRAPVLSESRPPSPAPRLTGTASLRPMPVRSVGGRAAGLGRPAPLAD
jgi:hypothetical protein